MTMLRHTIGEALAAAAAGFHVFPCHTVSRRGRCSCGCVDPDCKNRGKHPRLKRWQHLATTDADTIRRWWNEWPDANIGAAMDRSGLLAADIDPRNGGDESWARILREHTIPETWTNLTGGGGVHHFFKAPEGFTCRVDQLAPGVDIKWHGYTILPNSTHYSGQAYQWEIGYGPEDIAVAPLPVSIARLLQAPPDDESLPPRTPIAEVLTTRCDEGQRHNTLIRILGWARLRMTRDEAEGVVLAWNATQCKPPLDADYVVAQVVDAYERWDEPAVPVIDVDAPESTPEADTPALTVIPGQQLRTMPLPPVEWALQGFIPNHRYVVLSGESGVGKSWWILSFVLHAGRGLDFLGLPTQPVRALYIDEENGIQEAQRRIRALADGMGIPEDEPLPVDFVIDEGVRLGKPLHERQIIQLVREGSYDTIITDSLIRFFEGNENASQDVAAFHKSVDRIRREVAVLWFMLQHLNKPSREGGQMNAGDRLRGSTEFKAHADVHIQLRGSDGGGVVMHVDKLRGGVKPEDRAYRLEGDTALGEPVTLTPLASTAAAMGAVDAAIMHACDLLDSAGTLAVMDVVDQLHKRYGVPPRTGERAVAAARKAGSIVVDRREGKHIFLRLKEAQEW